MTSSRIPLSPIDHVFTGTGSYPLEFAFAYGGRIDPQALDRSLSRTLGCFPAVASRLVRQDGGWALAPDPAAGRLEVVESPVEYGAAGSGHERFVAPVETIEGELLARFRLTQTPRGSVLGVAVSHAVVDGFSYFHFLSSWSRVFRGAPFHPPCNERQRLCVEPGGEGLDLDADTLRRACGLFLAERRAPRKPRRLAWTRRVFTAGELHLLASEAQAGSPVRLSHNDVVAAWLWREHVSAWSPADEPLAWLSCPVDVRRLVPGLPATYFGCAVALATVSLEHERLAAAPLPELAQAVRAAVAAMDAARVSGALAVIDALRRAGGLEALERLHVVHPRAGLLVTNLSRLPVREIAFDAGAPLAFEVLVPAERCAIVLPAENGLDVRVCVPAAGAAAA